LLRLTTDGHKASRGLSATAELLVSIGHSSVQGHFHRRMHSDRDPYKQLALPYYAIIPKLTIQKSRHRNSTCWNYCAYPREATTPCHTF